MKRFMIAFGLFAFLFAAAGSLLIASGANADPDRKPATQDKSEGGPVFKRLGF